jgi:prepilin-type N-terminal cleavage/methylation domain-containing protein
VKKNSMRNGKCSHHPARAFTLVELLVTLTIIAVLVAILIPIVTKSIGKAHRVRLQSDLQTISAALEAYRSDFGDYPRSQALLTSTGTLTATGTDQPNPATGAEILCRALIGPAPATDPNAGNNPTILAQDGADGPGFRLRGTSGRIYGPYLAADKFKVYSLYANTAGGLPVEASSSQPLFGTPGGTFYPLDAVIADIDGNPILYFPARALKPNINDPVNYPNGYLGLSSSPPPTSNIPAYTKFSEFDADDNWIYMHYFFHDGQVAWRSSGDSSEAAGASSTSTLGFKRICVMFGDYDPSNPTAGTNFDGVIDTAGEHPINEPFVLWCAGPDGKFGPDCLKSDQSTFSPPTANDITKLDDATNIP